VCYLRGREGNRQRKQRRDVTSPGRLHHIYYLVPFHTIAYRCLYV
jgi:hypothetical protein